MKATKAQIKLIQTLLGKAGLRDEKRPLVSGLTGGRTDSLRELERSEAIQFIDDLKSKLNQPVYNEKSQRIKRYIFHLAHEIGLEDEQGNADRQKVDNWCKKHGKYHKNLNQHTPEELQVLAAQFEKMHRNVMEGLAHEHRD